MSPQLKSVTDVGLKSVTKKVKPYEIESNDFFTEREILRKRFAQLIEAPDYRNTAIIPAASYGIANAAYNVPINKGDEILLIDEQFPSNVYIWQEIARKNQATIKVVKPPKTLENRGKKWNENILEAINTKTSVVAMPIVHWADGTLFDILQIRKRARDINAMLIIDGTQSIGALPFSIKEIDPDALICSGYKWLLGPYSTGMAYYSDAFNEGIPMEHNWINRYNSEDFSNLTMYQDSYKEKATKYSVGESSNFILTPMLSNAIEQLLEWTPETIQHYCKNISETPIEKLRELGCFIEDEPYRTHHLFGVYLPEHIDLETLKIKLKQENIFVSSRGKALRVSCNVYNLSLIHI